MPYASSRRRRVGTRRRGAPRFRGRSRFGRPYMKGRRGGARGDRMARSVAKGFSYAQNFAGYPTIGRNKLSRAGTFRNSVQPDRLRVVMPYFDVYQYLLGTTGIGQYQAINGASIYDPDTSGVGHQPRGYDQYSAMYHKYRVLGCRIRIYGYISTNTIQQPVCVAIWVQDALPAPSLSVIARNMLESNLKARTSIITGYTTSSFNQAIFDIYTPYRVGVQGEVSMPGWTADVGADPQRSWYYQICAAPASSFDIPTGQIFNVLVRLDYYVEWSKPYQFGYSLGEEGALAAESKEDIASGGRPGGFLERLEAVRAARAEAVAKRAAEPRPPGMATRIDRVTYEVEKAKAEAIAKMGQPPAQAVSADGDRKVAL